MSRLPRRAARWLQEATLLATVIALSLAVWFVIVDAENREVEQRLGFSLSVGVINLAADLAVANEPLPVSVTVIGRQEDVDGVAPENLEATIDANGRARGRHSLPVRVRSLMEGVRVRSVQPETAVVELQQVEEREVPVAVEASGSPPLGFAVAQPSVDLAFATVTGISFDIEQITEAVARVDLGGLTVPVTRTVALEARTASGSPSGRVAIEPRFATVRIDVRQELFPRTVTVRPRIEGRPLDGYRVAAIAASPPTVDLVATVDEFEELASVDTAPISIEGRSTTLIRTVPLATTAGEAAAETQVRVTVQIEPILAEARVPVRLQIVNVPADWEASVQPSSARLLLRGAAAEIARLDSALEPILVDASGLAAGRHSITLEWSAPDGISVELAEISPAFIILALTEPPAPEPEEAEQDEDGQ